MYIYIYVHSIHIIYTHNTHCVRILCYTVLSYMILYHIILQYASTGGSRTQTPTQRGGSCKTGRTCTQKAFCLFVWVVVVLVCSLFV